MRIRIKSTVNKSNDSISSPCAARGNWARCAADFDWQALVDSGRPIELEIGTGKGLFLQSAAASHPDRQFIGIELARKFAEKTAERFASVGLRNAVLLCGDAEQFLGNVVSDHSLNAVHVYFPDPWWRRKHKKRRVLNEHSLLQIERSLSPSGCFHFWTDVLDYYEMICSYVMDHTNLCGPDFVAERTAEHDMDYTTHFERRARRHGQAIYRAVFRKSRQE